MHFAFEWSIQAIENTFGTNGAPQKVSAFEEPTQQLQKIQGDFSKPKATGTAEFSPQLMAKMEHVSSVLENERTGQTWSGAEVATMPEASQSRKFARNLAIGARVAGPIGNVLMTADALGAIERGDFLGWLAGTAIGIPKFVAAQFGIQIVATAIGGVAAFNPAGMAVIVGATTASLVDLTIGHFDPQGEHSLDFVNWLSRSGSGLGSALVRLMYLASFRNPLGDEVQAVIAGGRYVPVTLPPRTIERISSLTAGTKTAEAGANAIVQGMGLSPVDLDPTPQVSYNYLVSNPSAPASLDYSALVAETKEVRLQIKLRFVCSSWLFLQTDPGNPNPAAANQAACANYANAATAYTQSVYTNSGLPVDFIAVPVVEAARPFDALVGRDSISASTHMAVANDNNGAPLMPAITVTGTYFRQEAFRETCVPFSDVTCGDPNSIIPALRPTAGCAKYPATCTSDGGFRIPPGIPQIGFPTIGPCDYNNYACIGQANCKSPVECYCDLTGRTVYNSTKCPFQGTYSASKRGDSNGRNSCGCVVGWST